LDLRLIMDARVKPAHDEQAKSASPPLWPGKRREAPSSRPKAWPSRLMRHGRASLSEITGTSPVMTIICDICVGHSGARARAREPGIQKPASCRRLGSGSGADAPSRN